MGSKLLDLLRLGRCSHEFSWPRRWPDGEYYQVCLLCGEEYKYDWSTMSRLERLTDVRRADKSPRADSRSGRGRSRKKTSWSPRARRIKLNDQEMRYRQVGAGAWHRGTVENVSQTGILFRGADVLLPDTEVEMILEMPPEIIGQQHTQVIARGMVVRTIPPNNGKSRPAVAAGIWDYRVLHDQEESQAATTEPQPPDSEERR